LSEKIYRDSVHNIIRLKTGDDAGKLLARLIDTAEFQRLRRIKQLGLALYAYQAAEHSRFTHSLGALHLATRTLDKLKSKYAISMKRKLPCAAPRCCTTSDTARFRTLSKRFSIFITSDLPSKPS
jgi:HD superfamily phosphohydrolase